MFQFEKARDGFDKNVVGTIPMKLYFQNLTSIYFGKRDENFLPSSTREHFPLRSYYLALDSNEMETRVFLVFVENQSRDSTMTVFLGIAKLKKKSVGEGEQ